MKEKTLRQGENKKDNSEDSSLILLNDNINTFDHVIKSLVEICGHEPVQAEQCALIVHFKGSCDIKKGPREVMSVMSRSLNAAGLHSKVK